MARRPRWYDRAGRTGATAGRLHPAAVAVVVTIVAGLVSPPSPAAAGAQDDGEEPRPPLAALQPLDPALEAVAVSSPAYDAARADVAAASDARDDAADARDDAIARLGNLRTTETSLNADLLRAQARAADASQRIRRYRAELRALAVTYYVAGRGGAGNPLASLDVDDSNEAGSQRVLAESVKRRKVTRLRTARDDLDRAETDIELTTAALDGVRADIIETSAARDAAAADVVRFGNELLAASQRVDDERRRASVDAVELPVVVMDAYVKAARRMTVLAPDCGIPWWALAGIGQTESRHGTFVGAQVRPDGSLTKPITGIALTGGNGTARITDTDGGFYDRDPTLDRAVGPMQIIPSTWARWGMDANGDGRDDPQNLYDAAAGAAAYLCATGPMRDAAGQRRGFWSYNHSAAYVGTVLARAQRYGSLLPLSG